MGFIREPKGVDFVIEPSLTVKEDIAFIGNYIQKHKEKEKSSRRNNNLSFGVASEKEVGGV